MKMRSRALTAVESRIVGILYDDWRDLLRCTTIDQASRASGRAIFACSKTPILRFLLTSARAASLMRWEPAVYVLTNDEKLFARLILRTEPPLDLIPDPEDLRAHGIDSSSAGISQALER